MKTTFAYLLVAAVLIAGAAILWNTGPSPALAQAAGEPLAPHMGDFQRYMHKLGLALDAGNQPLADFYTQKIRENMEFLEKKYPTWDNLQIGALAKAMLGAPLAPMEAALKKGDMAAANSAYDTLMSGCNNCHVATQRPFIKITRDKTNTYSQNFAK